MKENSIKYISIYEDLKQQIVRGDYKVGDLVPAEPVLQDLFQASRITIRHAVQLLVDEGYLQRIHGVGTIVLSNKSSLQLQTLLSFSEENSDANAHSTLVSFHEEIIATPVVCSKLNLPKGSKVICHERLRWVNNEPIGFQRVFCPAFMQIKEIDLQNDASLYKLFREKGHVVTTANETIEAVIANKQLAKYLEIEEGASLLYVERVTRDQKNRLIEYAEIYYRGDKYRYNIQLQVP